MVKNTNFNNTYVSFLNISCCTKTAKFCKKAPSLSTNFCAALIHNRAMKKATLNNFANEKTSVVIPESLLHSGWWLEESPIFKKQNVASKDIINGSDKSCKR